MATYSELRDLFSNDTMLNKLDIAIMKSAQALLAGTPTVEDRRWASAVFANPRSEGEKAYRYVLAENSAAAIADIVNATDATIQTSVDAVRPSLVAAYN